jgi:hypothetical protein
MKMDNNRSYRLINFDKEDLRKAKEKKLNVTKFCREELHKLLLESEVY